jgi:tetratricopeptide (TPR) repeat protein
MPLVVRPDAVGLDELRRFVPVSAAEHRAALDEARTSSSRLYANRIAHLAAVVAGTRTHVAMAERLLRDERPGMTAVYLEAVDTVSHLFVKDAAHGRRAIEQAYVEVDAALGRLAAAAGPETWVIVCSDHGFHPPTAGLEEDPSALAGPASAWHRPYGIAAAAEAGRLLVDAPTASPMAASPAGTVTPLDIAPTVLHAAGLPLDAAMAGRVAVELVPPERAAVPPTRTTYAVPSPVQGAGPREAAIDATALARLQALGYVGSRPSSLAQQNLGEVLYRRGRLDAALRAFRTAVESQPQNLGAWLWLARTQQALGRTREALQSWTQAVRLPGGPQAALLPAVEAATAAGLGPEAEALLAGGVAAPPAVLHTARAVVASARGHFADAERALRAALRSDPTSFDALFRLFDVLQRQGRAAEALPALRRAAAAVAGSPRHAALLGEALLATGDAEAARRQLTSALDLAPDSSAVRLDLARAQLAGGHAAEALATLQPAPASHDRSILMGAACAASGRWSEAAAHYQDALRAGAPTPELLNGLGWALHRQGRNGEAADALRRSLALRADQPQIRQLLGTLGS